MDQPDCRRPFPPYSTKSNINAVNGIATFVGLTPTTNIITNETILTQHSINQVLQVFKKAKLQSKKSYNNSMTIGLLNQISLVISIMNNKRRA